MSTATSIKKDQNISLKLELSEIKQTYDSIYNIYEHLAYKYIRSRNWKNNIISLRAIYPYSDYKLYFLLLQFKGDFELARNFLLQKQNSIINFQTVVRSICSITSYSPKEVRKVIEEYLFFSSYQDDPKNKQTSYLNQFGQSISQPTPLPYSAVPMYPDYQLIETINKDPHLFIQQITESLNLLPSKNRNTFRIKTSQLSTVHQQQILDVINELFKKSILIKPSGLSMHFAVTKNHKQLLHDWVFRDHNIKRFETVFDMNTQNLKKKYRQDLQKELDMISRVYHLEGYARLAYIEEVNRRKLQDTEQLLFMQKQILQPQFERGQYYHSYYNNILSNQYNNMFSNINQTISQPIIPSQNTLFDNTLKCHSNNTQQPNNPLNITTANPNPLFPIPATSSSIFSNSNNFNSQQNNQFNQNLLANTPGQTIFNNTTQDDSKNIFSSTANLNQTKSIFSQNPQNPSNLPQPTNIFSSSASQPLGSVQKNIFANSNISNQSTGGLFGQTQVPSDNSKSNCRGSLFGNPQNSSGLFTNPSPFQKPNQPNIDQLMSNHALASPYQSFSVQYKSSKQQPQQQNNQSSQEITHKKQHLQTSQPTYYEKQLQLQQRKITKAAKKHSASCLDMKHQMGQLSKNNNKLETLEKKIHVNQHEQSADNTTLNKNAYPISNPEKLKEKCEGQQLEQHQKIVQDQAKMKSNSKGLIAVISPFTENSQLPLIFYSDNGYNNDKSPFKLPPKQLKEPKVYQGHSSRDLDEDSRIESSEEEEEEEQQEDTEDDQMTKTDMQIRFIKPVRSKINNSEGFITENGRYLQADNAGTQIQQQEAEVQEESSTDSEIEMEEIPQINEDQTLLSEQQSLSNDQNQQITQEIISQQILQDLAKLTIHHIDNDHSELSNVYPSSLSLVDSTNTEQVLLNLKQLVAAVFQDQQNTTYQNTENNTMKDEDTNTEDLVNISNDRVNINGDIESQMNGKEQDNQKLIMPSQSSSHSSNEVKNEIESQSSSVEAVINENEKVQRKEDNSSSWSELDIHERYHGQDTNTNNQITQQRMTQNEVETTTTNQQKNNNEVLDKNQEGDNEDNQDDPEENSNSSQEGVDFITTDNEQDNEQ